MRTHWIALYINNDNESTSYDATYFCRFVVGHIPREIKKFIGNKNIITNSYRIQTCNLIMCRYICIGFNDFMLKGPCLLDYTSLLSPNEHEKNDKIIPKYFQ